MGDKVQRAELPAVDEFMDAPHYAHGIATEVIESLETELRGIKALHASLIDLIGKTQSCTSGLSFGECLEAIKRRLAKGESEPPSQ